jgi:hypothetical protein
MSSPEPNQPPSVSDPGCLAFILVVVGGLMALVSGLCVGGGIFGTVLDLMEGAAPLGNILSVAFLYLLVSVPFLAGGIALIVWGIRMQRRTK